MTSRTTLLLTLAIIATIASSADAEMYGALSLGPAKIQDLNFRDRSTADLLLDTKSAWQLSGAIGYRFAPMFRAEISLGYLDGNARGMLQQNIVTIAACGITPNNPCLDAAVRADVKGTTALTMGYVDFATGGPVRPFIGLGVGLGRQSLEVTGSARTGNGPGTPFAVINGGDTEIATRATAGAAIDVGSVEVDVAYAYTRTGKPSLPARGALVFFTFDRPLKAHALTATARIPF